MAEKLLLDPLTLEQALRDEYITEEKPSMVLAPSGALIFNAAIDCALKAVHEADRVDAVEVVRCRDCVHYVKKDATTPGENRMRCDHPDLDYDIECYDLWLDVEPDGYCHRGEKRETKEADN